MAQLARARRPVTPAGRPVRRLLVVTAVQAESDAIRSGVRHADLPGTPAGTTPGDRSTPGNRSTPGGWSTSVDVIAVGVGPAAAAAGTARVLALAEAAGKPYQAVLCAGIAGGFPGRAAVGAVVLAVRAVAADLGAQAPEGFLSLDELGFGTATCPVDPDLLASLRARLPTATIGDVLTVSTVTGTARSAAALAARHPHAVAEAMEGYGVACACAEAKVAFAELRTIANPVGPRDRAAWRIGDALDALTTAASAAVPAALVPYTRPADRRLPDRPVT